jgi:hypothetical protein
MTIAPGPLPYYNVEYVYGAEPMGKIVHARIDDETRKLVEQVRRQTGWPESEIVRRAIKALACVTVAPGRRKVIGQGRFASSVADLGSNKKHLDGFGRR